MEKMERPRALILWQYSLIHWFSHNIYAKTSGYHLYTQTVRSSVDFLMSECLKIFLQTPMKEGLKIFVFNPKAGNFFPIRISTKICFFIYVNLIFCISIHSLIFDNVMHKLLRSRRGSSNGEKKSIPRRDEHSRNGSIYQKFNLDCYIRGVNVTECEMEALWFETLRIEYMINFQTWSWKIWIEYGRSEVDIGKICGYKHK